jgi:phosphatidate cytidylyltransferase
VPQARRRPPPQRSDLGARIAAGVPAALFALFIVASGGPIFAVGAALLGLACLHELYAMYGDLRPARLAGFLGLIGLVVAAEAGDTTHVLLVLAATVALTFLLTVAGPSIEGGTLGMAVVLLGVFWVGVAIAHAVMLRELPHGGGILADVLVGTFVGDTGAYLGGRAVGHQKLAPRISPNKTVEGLLCGIVAAILAVWIAGLYQDWLAGTDALLLGLGVALAAPIGDLFESYIKRDAGLKDTGRLFGAHGGALDRLDAILFTLVVGYYVWRALL